MNVVPVVDLSSPDAARRIGEAAEHIGFVSIVGHGVDAELMAAQWEMARSFFDAPSDVKLGVAMPEVGYPYGYAPFAYERLAASTGALSLPDLKETYTVGPVDRPTYVLSDPDEASAWSANLWPNLDRFQHVSEGYFRALSVLSARLLSLMAESLGLSPSYFEPLIDRQASALRMINYPELTSAPVRGQLRAGAHTDYGTLTVLLADPLNGGLEVQDGAGEWIPVNAPAGGFVVNLGDAMARWTNDRWRSTLHRVVPASGRRQSIAFFHNANWGAVIECLPGCLVAGETAKYEPIQAGPHLMSKFRAAVGA